MNAFFKQTAQKWLECAIKNPKRFFVYSMLFLSVSFVISMIQGIFFPSKTVFTIRPPVLYSKSSTAQNLSANNEKEMAKIVTELKALKLKRDRHALQKEDSLRIEYLFNQFQKLQHGH